MVKRVQDVEYYQDYYAKNKEKLLKQRKQWRIDNSERVKETSKLYRDSVKEQSKQWRDENKDRLYFLSVKARAVSKGLDFNLDIEDVIGVTICPVLGIALQRSKGKPAWNSPSLDRKDNTKGYIKGNVEVMSYLANSMKRDATPEQLILFANWVLKEKEVL